MAAAPNLPDFDELALELIQLQQREAEIDRRLEQAQDRHSACPSETTARLVSNLTMEMGEMRARINNIKVMLLPIMRGTGF